MKMLFSIIIPVLNEEKTIGKVLSGLKIFSSVYNTEIIVIVNLGSVDNTASVVEKFKKKIPNLKILRIKSEEFNHGETRNFGVKVARGKYVCFLTGHSIPIENFLDFFLEDFVSDKRVVVVFGKQIPYSQTPVIQKIELLNRFNQFEKYKDKNGLLIVDPLKPFTPLTEKTKIIWYGLFNSFSCYRKNYLLKRPFQKVMYGEDMLMGKSIVGDGLIKIYDSRCKIMHSHAYSISEYFMKEKQSLKFRSSLMSLQKNINIFSKVSFILCSDINTVKKTQFLLELFYYYILKGMIITYLRIKKT